MANKTFRIFLIRYGSVWIAFSFRILGTWTFSIRAISFFSKWRETIPASWNTKYNRADISLVAVVSLLFVSLSFSHCWCAESIIHRTTMGANKKQQQINCDKKPQNIVSEKFVWRKEFQSAHGLLCKNDVHICKQLCAIHLHKGKMEVMTQTKKNVLIIILKS